MFRIQAESICLQASVFETLERASALADAAIVACLRLALKLVFESHPPAAGALLAVEPVDGGRRWAGWGCRSSTSARTPT